MPNRALVLSGGGSRGAFEVGAADYLINDAGLDFQVIAGVSTGALNAVMLAQGRGPDGLRAQLAALKDLWFGIKSADDIYTTRFLGKVLAFVLKDSIYSSKPVRQKIQQHVVPERLRGSGRELRIGAVGLETGDYHAIDQRNPDVRAWALASASIPLLFPPVQIGGESAVDGGIRNVTPLEDAFDALKALPPAADGAADELYVALASPLDVAPVATRWTTGLKVAERAVEVLVNEVFREDLSYAIAINRSVRAYGDMRRRCAGQAAELQALDAMPFRPPKYRAVRIRTILPERAYSETLEFDPRKIREAFAAGRAAAQTPLDEDGLEAAVRR
ncbi:MAG TPA: patatin-like phospholipase family protein [Gemmatimonadales bacterium]|jgi:NTE family protein|nr:patatin-like phospholipase family protein [Gemmatimonadales bacterium]